LSNTSSEDWGFVTSGRFPFLNDCFGKYTLSFEAKAMKPDRRIFDIAVQECGCKRSNVFFTDDKLENVVGAQEAAIDAVQFISAEQLCRELRSRGVRGA
jgi:HAD superfamily hydrolase (TIGR01509 family)